MPEQRKDGALGGEHPLLRVHRGGGVDHEDDQVSGLPLANFLAKILAFQLELVGGIWRSLPPAELVRRSGPDGRIESDIGDLFRLPAARRACRSRGRSNFLTAKVRSWMTASESGSIASLVGDSRDSDIVQPSLDSPPDAPCCCVTSVRTAWVVSVGVADWICANCSAAREASSWTCASWWVT